ncbi:MAG: hypothetical protein ACKESB_00370 [Candidatus Hodgkinia cicadicola]
MWPNTVAAYIRFVGKQFSCAAASPKARFMVRGFRPLIAGVTVVLKAIGYREGAASKSGTFVYEKAAAA